jgi:hypothetical protein
VFGNCKVRWCLCLKGVIGLSWWMVGVLSEWMVEVFVLCFELVFMFQEYQVLFVWC